MREQLIQYVELLFAGVQDCEDIKQEILQNTLDRYDDLIAEGKVPEAAYRLAITGIGDIHEILGIKAMPSATIPPSALTPEDDTPEKKRMRAIAVALYILCPIPILLFGSMNSSIINGLGVCGTLIIVAIATALMILNAKKEVDKKDDLQKSPLNKSLSGLLWAVGVAVYFIISFASQKWHMTWILFPILGALDKLLDVLVQYYESGKTFQKKDQRNIAGAVIWAMGLTAYFILSFATGAWYITWLIFPITGAVNGLVRAILDYKEGADYET